MAKIYHAHLWGSREDKYKYLLENDITTVEWTELNPQSPFGTQKNYAIDGRNRSTNS